MDYHVCKTCGYQVDFKLNEETDDMGWWCETCGEWMAEDEVKEVLELTR